MSHRTVDVAPGEPLPVVAVGAGAMGRQWLAAVEASADARLVGVVDLDVDAARAAVAALGRPDLPVGTDAVELARSTGACAVLDVTVPAAHHPVTTAALRAGLPVLGEKPAAATVAQALSLAAAAEVSGELFVVSQSRRRNRHVEALRAMAGDRGDRGDRGTVGAVGSVVCDFFRAPRFGGFREEMEHPLLVDMAIHAFDTARYLLDAEPVGVWCDAHNPSWSWYAGAASATAVFVMDDGARFTWAGSWCAPGAETSWNGTWRVSGARGTALWDGEGEPSLHVAEGSDARARPPREQPEGIAGSLAAFCDALRTGTTPTGEVHENVFSLAMVEAAVESARTGGRVVLDAVLARAHETALHQEADPRVRDALAAWPSVREALVGSGAGRP